METLLPLELHYMPMEKLILINFEKNPEQIYKGLELQYLNATETGTGFRVLAYRNDGYVDMYDDPSLVFYPDEPCDVAEKGLNQHIQTELTNTLFEKVAGCVTVSFDFQDRLNRAVHVFIKEQIKKESPPFDLLAPIGVSSHHPSSLPLYFLYQFDFIRQRKTLVDIRINGVSIELDPFPFSFPLSGQMRYFVRYTMESQIIDFVPVASQLKKVSLDDELRYQSQQVVYQFANTAAGLGLAQIELLHPKKVIVLFTPAIELNNQSGTFSVHPPEQMGHIDGTYQVMRQGDEVNLMLKSVGGWTSKPTSWVLKRLLASKSVFCSWPKKYHYTAQINLATREVKSNWTNGNSLTEKAF